MFVINPKWLFKAQGRIYIYFEDYNQYYYGVRADEVIAGRPALCSGFNDHCGARIDSDLSNK